MIDLVEKSTDWIIGEQGRSGVIRAMARAVMLVEDHGPGTEKVQGVSASLVTAEEGLASTDVQSLVSSGLTLDHLGLAVRSIAASRVFYEMLGLAVNAEEVVEHEQVRTAMLPLGETRIELLEAIAKDSVIGRFVAKRGEGVHHIALRSNDVDVLFHRMEADGTRLASDQVQIGAGGHRYFFIHPSSAGGVLIEIVGQ